MKVALCQLHLTAGDLPGNVARLLASLREAAARGAELAVASELCVVGGAPGDLLERPAFLRAGREALEQLAARAPLPAIVGFVDVERHPEGEVLHDAVALLADGTVASVHRKCVLVSRDVRDDHRHFTPAPPASRRPATLHGRSIAIAFEDETSDEASLRALAKGAELVVLVGLAPFSTRRRLERPRSLAALARALARPLCYANAAGGAGELVYAGASQALDAEGVTIARAREVDEDLVIVDTDARRGELRELVSLEAAVLDALTVGVRDHLHGTGFRSAVLGLSGGVDSALVAALAARALGPEHVLGVAMPSRHSSDHSLADAAALARNLGIRYLEIPIAPLAAAFEAALAPAFAGRPADVTEENIQARCRCVVLMSISNKLGHMVLATGNKSELAVGYCTQYGDLAGGLAVIADVPKTLVYGLCRELERQAGRELVPSSTMTKAPSAELRPGQTDQDTLPPYPVLDAILELHVEDALDADEIVARGHDPKTVADVLRMVRASEHKRRQAPPGLRISEKAFGSGRRMPLVSRF